MKELSIEEQKRYMLEMLKYIDEICRNNEIKYSLLGGSLIGAIREKGMIPWDDDIDIILTPKNYDKLISVLEQQNGNSEYILYTHENNKNYYYPFAKLIYAKTKLKENVHKEMEEYGLFVDIFKYTGISNNKLMQYIHYYTIRFEYFLLEGIISEEYMDNKNHKILRKIRRFISKKIGLERILKMFDKTTKSPKKFKYMMSDNPVYSTKNEVQELKDFNEYIDCEFDNIKVMITKEYDKVLRKYFGDYMTPPEEKERIRKHNIKVYWREKNEK